jgi:hypothetical protein
MIRASQAQTTRFILGKTYLTAQEETDIVTMVKRLVALPADETTAPFLALRARVANFQPDDLLTELYQTRRLIKRPAMRNEPGLIAVDDSPLLLIATQRQRRRVFNTEFINWDIELSEVEALGQKILEVIGTEPTTAEAIIDRLPQEAVRELRQTSRGGRVSTMSNVTLALRWLKANGQLVLNQALPPADWREETPSYVPLSTWLPHLDLPADLSESEAQLHLARAYLAAFGPATEADISFWTGFSKSETQRAVNALTSETTLAMVDGIPGAMLMPKDQADTLRGIQPPAEPVINLLPADDPFVKAHKASRARLFAEPRWQRQIFSTSDRAKPAILVDGKIMGSWAWEKTADQDKITWQLFADVEGEILSPLQIELERLAAFIAPDTVIEPFST